MKHFRLQRLVQNSHATYGQITDDENRLICRTLERPWLNNAHDVSCIPAGEYPAHRVTSPKRGYEVFMLDGVPDRTAIELHIGNVVAESEGCILLGTGFGEVKGEHGVIDSREAFAEFMRLLAGESNFVLTVLDPEAPSFAGEDGG